MPQELSNPFSKSLNVEWSWGPLKPLPPPPHCHYDLPEIPFDDIILKDAHRILNPLDFSYITMRLLAQSFLKNECLLGLWLFFYFPKGYCSTLLNFVFCGIIAKLFFSQNPCHSIIKSSWWALITSKYNLMLYFQIYSDTILQYCKSFHASKVCSDI